MADLLPLIGFVFFGLFSPGPNVILITTSAMRFGLRATLPHVFGVAIGVGVIAGVVGLGLGAALLMWPSLVLALKIVAAVWIAWMAYGLWFLVPSDGSKSARPFSFLEAVLFQWVNPKIWAVALVAMTYVVGDTALVRSLTLGMVFMCINVFVCLFWAWAGSWLTWLRDTPVAWRIFMRLMAVGLLFFSLAVFL